MDSLNSSNPVFDTVVIINKGEENKEYCSVNLYEVDNVIQRTVRTVKTISKVLKNNIVQGEQGVIRLNDFERTALLECIDLIADQLNTQSLAIQKGMNFKVN